MNISKRGLFLALFGFILILPLVSAEIVISPTEALYNYGDNFLVDVSVKPTQDSTEFLTVALVCQGGRVVELYRSPFSISAGNERNVQIESDLDKFLVGGIVGECFIRADYGVETSTSPPFTITGDVDVSFDLEELVYSPGDGVNIQGTAIKANGEPLTGIVEITVTGADFVYSGNVIDGKFGVNFTLPSDAPAGSYPIEVVAYEMNNKAEVTNIGEVAGVLKVKQIMKSVEIALDSTTIVPDNELTFNVIVYDQSRVEMSVDVSVEVLRPDGSVATKQVVKSGVSENFELAANDSSGKWQVIAYADQVESKKQFSVEELEKIDFELEESTLVVYNRGNVPYNGPLEISIGGINEVKQIENLGVGAVKRYKLVAPDGEYEIRVNDGDERQVLGSALLTGRVVSVEDVGEVVGGSAVVLTLIFLVIIALVIVIYIYRRKKKAQFVGKTSGSFTQQKAGDFKPIETKAPSHNLISGKKKDMKAVPSGDIDKGERQESVVISLNLKNLEQIQVSGEGGLHAIDSALWKAKESGAKIYSDGEFRVIVLAPVLSKEKDIVMHGLRIAYEVDRRMREFNKRARQKIEYGMGVNLGELIVESSSTNKFKFISTDNTISSTKRLSQKSSEELLISERVRRKSVGKIKASKKDENTFVLDKLTDRSAHQEFITKFKSRQAR